MRMRMRARMRMRMRMRMRECMRMRLRFRVQLIHRRVQLMQTMKFWYVTWTWPPSHACFVANVPCETPQSM